MWPGFSFALHLLRVQGFYFCPDTIQPHTSVYGVFYAVHATYTAHDTRPTQAAILPPVQRWSVSQRRSTSSAYQIPVPRRTLYRSAQLPYYNKVYKGAAVRSCYRSIPARRGLDTSHARLKPWHRISLALTWHYAFFLARAARNHWRLSPYLFSGFRPIANRG